MSLDKIPQLIGSLVKTIEDNQKIATPILAAKLAKCLKSYPEDQTIGAMSRVIEKMADNNTMFIRKADLQQLYKKLHSRNTKFAQLFEEELGVTESLPTPTTYQRDQKNEAVQVNTYDSADPILANALNSVFDKFTPLKLYSQKLADQAKVSVGSTLDAWNLRPTSLNVSDGNDKFLVIKADYETPKGITSFYVPVEIENNKIVEASGFLGNTGLKDLNNTNIKSYLKEFAGIKLKISGTDILNVMTKNASENRNISDIELALIRYNSTKKVNAEFSSNQVLGLKLSEEIKKDVELPKSDEFKSFEEQFTSIQGQADFQFGADKVKLARDYIVRELTSLGHKNPQIVITSIDNNSIFYGVSLDAGRVAFTVPVKLANGKLQKPTILICNGSLTSFDSKGINALYVNNETDYKVAAAASPMFGLKPSDLVNNIRTALIAGNHTAAEDALNVLSNSGDVKAYASGFQVFLQGLNKVAHTAEESKCSRMIKNATSEHPICSHTGLPIHKVYQDKHGNCLPLYRRGMDETYEGASFMNSKIFG